MTNDFDRMTGSIFAFLEDGIPHQALFDLSVIAQNTLEFEAGMNALVELGDILSDHYEQPNEEPDDGHYEEYERYLWGTEGDDWDPPEDWFEDGGPFGPDDDDDL